MSAYDSIWDAPIATIADPAEEAATIEAAQGGDEAATLRLLAAYVPALKKALTQYGSAALPLEDARQAAVLGLMEAIRQHDPARGARLAGHVVSQVQLSVGEAAATAAGGFTVPARTLRRFFGILRDAGGDATEALKLARSSHMSEEVFIDILTAVRKDESLDELIEGRGDLPSTAASVSTPTEIADVEDRILVEVAFRAVGELEREVTRLAYGFADYRPIGDAEIGDRLGYSRSKVLRTRNFSLSKMREALHV